MPGQSNAGKMKISATTREILGTNERIASSAISAHLGQLFDSDSSEDTPPPNRQKFRAKETNIRKLADMDLESESSDEEVDSNKILSASARVPILPDTSVRNVPRARNGVILPIPINKSHNGNGITEWEEEDNRAISERLSRLRSVLRAMPSSVADQFLEDLDLILEEKYELLEHEKLKVESERNDLMLKLNQSSTNQPSQCYVHAMADSSVGDVIVNQSGYPTYANGLSIKSQEAQNFEFFLAVLSEECEAAHKKLDMLDRTMRHVQTQLTIPENGQRFRPWQMANNAPTEEENIALLELSAVVEALQKRNYMLTLELNEALMRLEVAKKVTQRSQRSVYRKGDAKHLRIQLDEKENEARQLRVFARRTLEKLQKYMAEQGDYHLMQELSDPAKAPPRVAIIDLIDRTALSFAALIPDFSFPAYASVFDLLLVWCQSAWATETVTRNIAGTMRTLAKEERNRMEMVNRGVAPAMIRLLNLSDHASTLEQAAACISNLSIKHQSIRKVILDSGGVDALIRLLHKHQTQPLLEKACAALSNLACGDEEVKGSIARLGGIELLVRMCKEKSADGTKEQAARALRNLAHKSDLNCRRISASGGLEALTRLWQQSKNSRVAAQAAAALSNLATNETIKVQLKDQFDTGQANVRQILASMGSTQKNDQISLHSSMDSQDSKHSTAGSMEPSYRPSRNVSPQSGHVLFGIGEETVESGGHSIHSGFRSSRSASPPRSHAASQTKVSDARSPAASRGRMKYPP